MMILGYLLGLYVGVWIFFVGGIMDIVGQIQGVAEGLDLNITRVFVGVIKMVLASLAGYISAIVLVIPGVSLLSRSREIHDGYCSLSGYQD